MAGNKITKEILGNFYNAVINEADKDTAVTALTDASSGSPIINDDQAKILQGFYGIDNASANYEALYETVKAQTLPEFKDDTGNDIVFNASNDEHIYQMLQAIPNQGNLISNEDIKGITVEVLFGGILIPANNQAQIESLVKLGLWKTKLDASSDVNDKKQEIATYFNEMLLLDLLKEPKDNISDLYVTISPIADGPIINPKNDGTGNPKDIKDLFQEWVASVKTANFANVTDEFPKSRLTKVLGLDEIQNLFREYTSKITYKDLSLQQLIDHIIEKMILNNIELKIQKQIKIIEISENLEKMLPGFKVDFTNQCIEIIKKSKVGDLFAIDNKNLLDIFASNEKKVLDTLQALIDCGSLKLEEIKDKELSEAVQACIASPILNVLALLDDALSPTNTSLEALKDYITSIQRVDVTTWENVKLALGTLPTTPPPQNLVGIDKLNEKINGILGTSGLDMKNPDDQFVFTTMVENGLKIVSDNLEFLDSKALNGGIESFVDNKQPIFSDDPTKLIAGLKAIHALNNLTPSYEIKDLSTEKEVVEQIKTKIGENVPEGSEQTQLNTLIQVLTKKHQDELNNVIKENKLKAIFEKLTGNKGDNDLLRALDTLKMADNYVVFMTISAQVEAQKKFAEIIKGKTVEELNNALNETGVSDLLTQNASEEKKALDNLDALLIEEEIKGKKLSKAVQACIESPSLNVLALLDDTIKTNIGNLNTYNSSAPALPVDWNAVKDQVGKIDNTSLGIDKLNTKINGILGTSDLDMSKPDDKFVFTTMVENGIKIESGILALLDSKALNGGANSLVAAKKHIFSEDPTKLIAGLKAIHALNQSPSTYNITDLSTEDKLLEQVKTKIGESVPTQDEMDQLDVLKDNVFLAKHKELEDLVFENKCIEISKKYTSSKDNSLVELLKRNIKEADYKNHLLDDKDPKKENFQRLMLKNVTEYLQSKSTGKPLSGLDLLNELAKIEGFKTLTFKQLEDLINNEPAKPAPENFPLLKEALVNLRTLESKQKDFLEMSKNKTYSLGSEFYSRMTYLPNLIGTPFDSEKRQDKADRKVIKDNNNNLFEQPISQLVKSSPSSNTTNILDKIDLYSKFLTSGKGTQIDTATKQAMVYFVQAGAIKDNSKRQDVLEERFGYTKTIPMVKKLLEENDTDKLIAGTLSSSLIQDKASALFAIQRLKKDNPDAEQQISFLERIIKHADTLKLYEDKYKEKIGEFRETLKDNDKGPSISPQHVMMSNCAAMDHLMSKLGVQTTSSKTLKQNELNKAITKLKELTFEQVTQSSFDTNTISTNTTLINHAVHEVFQERIAELKDISDPKKNPSPSVDIVKAANQFMDYHRFKTSHDEILHNLKDEKKELTPILLSSDLKLKEVVPTQQTTGHGTSIANKKTVEHNSYILDPANGMELTCGDGTMTIALDKVTNQIKFSAEMSAKTETKENRKGLWGANQIVLGSKVTSKLENIINEKKTTDSLYAVAQSYLLNWKPGDKPKLTAQSPEEMKILLFYLSQINNELKKIMPETHGKFPFDKMEIQVPGLSNVERNTIHEAFLKYDKAIVKGRNEFVNLSSLKITPAQKESLAPLAREKDNRMFLEELEKLQHVGEKFKGVSKKEDINYAQEKITEVVDSSVYKERLKGFVTGGVLSAKGVNEDKLSQEIAVRSTKGPKPE